MPAPLSRSIQRAAAAFAAPGELETRFLSVAFFVPAKAQGAVHLEVRPAEATDEHAARFAQGLREAARAEGHALQVVWSAVTHGPHGGERLGAAVCDVTALEAPRGVERLHISQTLSAARALSEDSVVAIGDELRDLQGLASSQVGGLKQVALQFSDEGAAEPQHEATVAGTFEQLAGHVRTFGEEILVRTRKQAADIEHARGWTADIVKLGQAIGSIAGNARLLAFNARLESARLGEAGRGFTVIAAAIQELAVQVRSTNDSVARLAENLARALPRLGADALESAKSTQEAVSVLEARLGDLQGRLAAVRAQSWRAIAQSSELAEELHQKTNSVIHHLQFQDRASQMLEDVAEQVSVVLDAAGLVETPVDEAVLSQVGHLGRELEPSATVAPGSVELF